MEIYDRESKIERIKAKIQGLFTKRQGYIQIHDYISLEGLDTNEEEM